ncbi:apolipoprotein a-iv a [Anaeramoeba flamelloides]|uniref:Apolipoprotein a-iv a n=1 Tax=Anaeramoeba flamelloides TaxID=1746091 RepID=A0ABQ8YH46_9EUKA|nr:apolipoprotein a-iv a [Anaeramoeba flamelloides]
MTELTENLLTEIDKHRKFLKQKIKSRNKEQKDLKTQKNHLKNQMQSSVETLVEVINRHHDTLKQSIEQQKETLEEIEKKPQTKHSEQLLLYVRFCSLNEDLETKENQIIPLLDNMKEKIKLLLQQVNSPVFVHNLSKEVFSLYHERTSHIKDAIINQNISALNINTFLKPILKKDKTENHVKEYIMSLFIFLEKISIKGYNFYKGKAGNKFNRFHENLYDGNIQTGEEIEPIFPIEIKDSNNSMVSKILVRKKN